MPVYCCPVPIAFCANRTGAVLGRTSVRFDPGSTEVGKEIDKPHLVPPRRLGPVLMIVLFVCVCFENGVVYRIVLEPLRAPLATAKVERAPIGLPICVHVHANETENGWPLKSTTNAIGQERTTANKNKSLCPEGLPIRNRFPRGVRQ